MNEGKNWLNGWRHHGGSVLIGSAVCCACCGKCHGITCIGLTGDEVWPKKSPDWPFNENDCPLCQSFAGTGPPTPSQLELASDSALRMELIRRKKLKA